MGRSTFVSILALCASLYGGDLLTPGEQVLKELRGALTAGDADAAKKLLTEVGGLYRYPASQHEARALLALAAEAARDKNPVIARAALQAVGATGAPEGAAVLKTHLRSKSTLALAAVQAAGKLRHETLIPLLLDLAKTSADLTTADQALFALGEYCGATVDVRKRVTERVLPLCQSISRNSNRWRRLRGPGLRALQRLMARRLNSLQQFSDWWRFRKGSKDPFSASGG